MPTNTLRIAAATVAVLLITSTAEARRYRTHFQLTPRSTVTEFCGDRVCGFIQPGSRLDANGNKGRRAARYLRVEKPQQYVRPRYSTEKLITREAYEQGSGIVRSRKTGATARVSPKFARIAQAVVDDLEQNYGASIRFMGGYRKGPCWSGGLHPCGLAIDLCQTARGVVDRRCNLPSRAIEAQVASAHGALSGGIWCNQDRGHIQLGKTAGACGSNLYSAIRKFKKRHVRVARYR